MSIRDPEKFCSTLWDWGFLQGCFPRVKISPTDLDCGLKQHLTEINGNFLFIECKLPGVGIPFGQKRTHDSLINTGVCTVLIIHGIADPMKVIKLEKRTPFKPQTVEIKKPCKEAVRKFVKSWAYWADSKPIKPSDKARGDIEYFTERAAILEYDAGYARCDAEEAAIKMMLAKGQADEL